jgi:hypothetical protein
LISPAAQESLGYSQMIAKMRQSMARINAEGTGGDNFQNLLFSMEATPGTEMDKRAAMALTADLMVARQRDMDMMMYAQDYGREAARTTRIPTMQRGFPTGDAKMTFSQSPVFSIERYQSDSKNLAKIFSNGSYEILQKALSDPKQADAVKKELADRTGSPLFYRYLIGRF